MHASMMLNFQQAMDEEGVIFSYRGYVTEKILGGIGEAMKQKFTLQDTDKNTTRGIFAIFVEQVQNVIRYSAENETVHAEGKSTKYGYGMILVGHNGDKYYVACGNVISSEDVPPLEEHLKELKTLDRQQLKEKHKEILKGDTPEKSKGAGVGLIDIARRASEGFEFEFTELEDASQHYFSLLAYV